MAGVDIVHSDLVPAPEFDHGINIHSAPGTFTTLPEVVDATPADFQVSGLYI